MGLTIGNGCDFNDFAEGVQDVLSMDQDEAACDDCIWASMEWTWQVHISRNHKKSKDVRPSVASRIVRDYLELRKRSEGGQ